MQLLSLQEIINFINYTEHDLKVIGKWSFLSRAFFKIEYILLDNQVHIFVISFVGHFNTD